MLTVKLVTVGFHCWGRAEQGLWCCGLELRCNEKSQLFLSRFTTKKVQLLSHSRVERVQCQSRLHYRKLSVSSQSQILRTLGSCDSLKIFGSHILHRRATNCLANDVPD